MKPLKQNWHLRILLLMLFTFLEQASVFGQCIQNYDWAVWSTFSDSKASASIKSGGREISMEVNANYSFSFTDEIFNYIKFGQFQSLPPNERVPMTNWAFLTPGETVMCFSEVVKNPVLLLSSLGRVKKTITLELSTSYLPIYDGGGMTFLSDSTVLGEEGFAILLFPGEIQCITIYSSTNELYTNFTWGLNPPLFPIDLSGNLEACTSATITASGGDLYNWSGGVTPNSATNTFNNSGTYFLTVSDKNGCDVTTSVQVKIGEDQCEDCAGTINGTSVIDNCDVCLEPSDPLFNRSCIQEDLIRIPDAFTPNGDGINDTFEIVKRNDANAQILSYSIFNRWGELVYYASNFDFDSGSLWWNGKSQGEEASIGNYAYSIVVEFENGEIIKYKGSLKLIN